MKNNFIKIFGVMLVTIASLFSAGCFQGESNLTIDDNGKVTMNIEIMGVPILREHIEGWKNEMERSNRATEISPVSSGNMSGYRITMQYQSIEQFAAQKIDIFGSKTGKAKGIQQRKGWFFDAYSFDFLSEAPEDSEEYLDNTLVQSMMPQIKFDMVINLPYVAEKNNAQHVSNDNKTLSWNLASSITSGKDVSVQVQFRIWHKEKIAVTAAVILILLGAMIYFLRKSQKQNENQADNAEGEAAKNIFYMKICAGLLAAVISASAFMLINPVTFTDADIISSAITAK